MPRKNLVNLLKAFDEFKKYDNRGIKLVMAGARKWWSEDMQAAYDQMQYRGDVIFTGRITDKELAGLMGSALALTYVSYYEGFGIPMLEAFKSDTPVMASNVTSLPEIAGDAAILIDPHSTESICNAMKRMANEPALRQQLIEAGRLQREKFSWDKTADKLWQCMEKAMQ